MEFYECCPIRHNGIKVLDNVLFRLDREDKVVFMGDEIAVTILFNILIVEEEIDASTFKCGVTACQSYLSKKRLLLRYKFIFNKLKLNNISFGIPSIFDKMKNVYVLLIQI